MRILYNILLICLLPVFFWSEPVSAQVSINPGTGLVLKEGSTLTIKGDLMLKSNDTAQAVIVDQTSAGGITVEGTTTVQCYLTSDAWHNFAAPVNNASTGIFTTTDLIYYYDESIVLNDWDFGWILYSGPLAVMKGYDILIEGAPFVVSYVAPNPFALNTGPKSINVTYTTVTGGEIEEHKGWNILGNPYPSPVDWLATGWDKTPIDDAMYIWNPEANNYATFIGGSIPQGINGGTQYIPAMQGFWVKAYQNGTVSLSNSVRVLNTPGTPSFYKNDVDITSLKLIAEGETYSDEAMIRFYGSGTIQFDPELDARKLFSYTEAVPQIYMPSPDGTLLSINTRENLCAGMEIPLCFRCKTSGIFHLYPSSLESFNDTIMIYLEDKKEKKVINLKESPFYTFTYLTNDTPSRFTILINPSEEKLANLFSDNHYSIYSYGSKVYIRHNTSGFTEGEIFVYNILGSLIYNHSLSADQHQEFLINTTLGYHIVKLTTPSDVYAEKVFLK